MAAWRFSASVYAMLCAFYVQSAQANDETLYPPPIPDVFDRLVIDPRTTASFAPVMDPATTDKSTAAITSGVVDASLALLPLVRLVAERLPLIVTSVPRLGEAERQSLIAYYARRDNRPLWIVDGRFSASAVATASKLSSASEDGLFARDYPLPPLVDATEATMIEAELRLSALAVLYARDARGGRLEPRRISSLMTPKLALPTASDVLDKLLGAPDAHAALGSYHPPHAGYLALKGKLAEIRKDRTAPEPMVQFPAGPPLRIGMRDARVPLIRARLNLGPNDEAVYDDAVASAVSAFQKNAGLRVTGIAGASTLEAMRVSPVSRLDSDIVAQMERWRWLPADMGARHIFVNIPEYNMRLISDGSAIHTARVIIGKAETPTPVFSHVMDYLVMNPSWFIPPSILKKDILPKLAADPDYAAKRGYIVTQRGNNISVRQPPGERNALGNVKFMFPNEHAVYLHDTPGRHLFSAEKRAFSHGCVRVDQPMKLAEMLLGKSEGWSEQRLRAMVGRGERTIRFTNPLPVHLVYMTHIVNADGVMTTLNDVYGFHQRVRSALGLGS